MIIDVIVCHTDGTQSLEQREVAEDWFVVREEALTEAEQETE